MFGHTKKLKDDIIYFFFYIFVKIKVTRTLLARTHHNKIMEKYRHTWTQTDKQTTVISPYVRKAQVISPEVWAY